MSNNNHPFKITVVVGGEPEKITVKPDETVLETIAAALKKAKNQSRPAEEWELKTETGPALSQAATLGALGISEGATLYASLTTGAAG